MCLVEELVAFVVEKPGVHHALVHGEVAPTVLPDAEAAMAVRSVEGRVELRAVEAVQPREDWRLRVEAVQPRVVCARWNWVCE